jgi:hypothetical protein
MFRPISRGAGHAIVMLFAVSFALAGLSFAASVHAVRGEIASRASVVQLCKAGNDLRGQQIVLWTHIVQISQPPPGQTAAQKAARGRLIAGFIGYIHRVFAPRDCAGRYGG